MDDIKLTPEELLEIGITTAWDVMYFNMNKKQADRLFDERVKKRKKEHMHDPQKRDS